jgi:spore coat polysaccharide biosynthesis protein SpsF
MKIVCFIQARLGGSTRLGKPKIMQLLRNKTIIEHIYNRCMMSNRISEVYCAIPDNEPILEKFLKSKGLKFLKGNHFDVLNRFYECNNKVKADHVVRITCDCAVMDYKIINQLIDKHLIENNDYTANNFFHNHNYADGMDCEIIKADILNDIHKKSFDKHRQHVTSYIREFYRDYKCGIMLDDIGDYRHLRLTIDYPEDLQLIKIIYDRLFDKNNYFGYNEIIELYKKEPVLFQINNMYARDFSYYKDK